MLRLPPLWHAVQVQLLPQEDHRHNKRSTFYYFRSIWNQKDITLHLLPHWNWPGEEGVFKQVVAYTSCEEVKLYINGRLVGTKGYDFPNVGALKAWNDRSKYTNPTTHDLHLVWDVPYEAGELKAEGYIGGKLVATEIIRTTGRPVQLVAKADRDTLKVDGIAHIDISTLDANGLYVPDASNMIHCEVIGKARLIGMDSGDMRDCTLSASKDRKLFSGLLMAMVYADEPGDITVKLSGEGLKEVTLHLKAE